MMEFSYDFLSNTSSLVPLTKPTLSCRESVGHLVSPRREGIFVQED